MAYRKCLIIGYVGPKGGGKSLSMAQTIVWKLLSGENVWSNMPVKLSDALINRKTFVDGSDIKYKEASPLDWNLLYMLDDSIVEGTVAIDEMTYFADSRQSGSTKNRLINACIRQVRHRNLNVVYTALDMGMVDYRLRLETDLVIECEDMAYKPWGKENDVEGGITILQRYYDLSGSTTGYRTDYFNKKKQYKAMLFHGRPYWECYDTREVISLEEAFTGVELDLQKRRISNRESFNDETAKVISDVLLELKSQGHDRVPNDVFWDMLRTHGIEGDHRQLGRYIPGDVRRGQGRDGSFYDLSNMLL